MKYKTFHLLLGEKVGFSINGIGKTGYPSGKNKSYFIYIYIPGDLEIHSHCPNESIKKVKGNLR